MARPEIVEADAAEFEMGVFTSFITSKARAAFVIVINMFSHIHIAHVGIPRVLKNKISKHGSAYQMSVSI